MEAFMTKQVTPKEIALFRYGIIADFANLPPGTKGLYALLKEKAEREYVIPGSRRTRIRQETIRSWLKKYRQNGFDALMPKERADKGVARKMPIEVTDLLLALKETEPELTVPLLIKKARLSGKITNKIRLPESTVYKLLSRHGLNKKNHADSTGKDHRRFSFQDAGELWMSDVMHGPAVKNEKGRKRKTYLIALIDDATRVISFAAFAFSENTTAFMEVFKQSIMRRGLPHRLFVDNGSAFRSQHLSLVCAKLGITLIHARPYHAAAKGKIERWFRTVRMQFLPLLSEEDKQSLTAINRALWRYVEMEYHRTPHRSLGETPLDRWARVGQKVRYCEPGIDLDDLFLFEAKRKVQKDRTISLNGMAYEVDASLVGETVTLRYNPANQGKVIKVCYNGQFVEEARLVDVYANCFVKRNRPSNDIEEVEQEPGNTKSMPQDSTPKHTINFSRIAGTEDKHV
jgi:transposase InsO family protein